MFYRLGRAGKALRRIGAIDFATTVAPGVRDVCSPARPTKRSAVARDGPGVRRRGARCPADRAHHPVPQRQHRSRRAWPRSARSGARRTRSWSSCGRPERPSTSSRCSRRCRSRRPLDGAAELHAAGLPVGAWSSTSPHASCCAARCAERRARANSTRRDRARSQCGRAPNTPRIGRARCSARHPTTPNGSPSSAERRRLRSLGSPCTNSTGSLTESTSRPLRAGRPTSRQVVA